MCVCVLYPCLTFPLLASREVIIRIHSCYQITIFDSKQRCLSHFSSFLLQVRLPFWRGNFLPRWHWSSKLGMKIGFTWFRNKAIKIFFFKPLAARTWSLSSFSKLFFLQIDVLSKLMFFKERRKKVWKEEEPERKSRCSATCLCALLPRKGRKRPLLKKRKNIYIALLSAKLWLSEEPDAPLHKKGRIH